MGVARELQHHIDTGDTRPRRHRHYRVAPSERHKIEKEVNKMLSKYIIQPSWSPWSSSVLLVTNEDGSIRFCVDHRRNKVTSKDVYPMLRIDDALDSLRGATYPSSLDFRPCCWQIPMACEDKEKTAFFTPDGIFEFNVMPFGLSNAPATFERMMDTVLRGLRWQICLCYLDDIVVCTASFSEHQQRLDVVLSCLLSAELQLHRRNCHFAFLQIKVLGRIVSTAGVSPDTDNIKVVTDFPVP